MFLRNVDFYKSHRAVANCSTVVPSSLIDFNVMKATRYTETSVLTIATRRNIPEDCIIHSYCCEDLNSYIALTGWAL
jgi:hypothetical protein